MELGNISGGKIAEIDAQKYLEYFGVGIWVL